MEKENIKKLLSGLCCSYCKHDFDENSIIIRREEQNLMVLQIVCPACGKNFGIAFLGAGDGFIKPDETNLEIKDCPLPISYDDVLDAHKFIDKLEKDWTKYIPNDLKNL